MQKKKIKKKFDSSKNILRLYQRGIYKFIQKHEEKCEEMIGDSLKSINIKRRQLMGNISSIRELKQMWISEGLTEKEKRINKMIRIMSYKFLCEEAV